MSNEIQVLIVDDEPLARRGLRRLLESEQDFVVAGEASNGDDAAAKISNLKPDVVFLDIQMPLLDGLTLIEKIDARSLPEIVFVTAFDEHAVQAFETGAIDYVLKPINAERFRKTLDRVRRRVETGGSKGLDNRLAEILSDLLPANNAYLERIAVRADERIRFLNVSQIDWIRSQGNYIEIHSKDETFLLRETMNGIEKKLDPRDFLRIRRSTMVRIGSIKELQTLFGGEYTVVLNDGTEFLTSRRFRRNLDSYLKI